MGLSLLSRRGFLALAGTVLASGAGFSWGCARDGSGAAQASGPGAGSGAESSPSPEDSADASPGAASEGTGAADASSWLDADPQETTLFLFDTVITLRCYCSPELLEQAEERCRFFEERFSRTLSGSDVWNVNHAEGARVKVAPETADLVSKALGYCERSGGLFDITIGAVSSLWDFVGGVKPDDDEVAEALRHIDWRGVHVEGDEVWLDDPLAMIDLGGVAKGYIADDLAALLREGGCESAIINLGGNVYALGTKPDGSPWSVGVQDPNAAVDQAVVAKVPCTDASVVTSGLYERQFQQDGQTYYHILDPKTGYPVQTDLISSSVVCESSLDGDAFATWMFLLGHDEALRLLEEEEGLEGLVVDSAGAITMTQGARFELL